ncbi:hypothetical protein SUGI_0103610 [Cryptomeria japonica]|nr:hypothetical protein SUGI_0103570 [Cryptomeria japonica]GLJ09196.1 hypothetical protein SUGI_0103610 [Cryptomeria japonica]
MQRTTLKFQGVTRSVDEQKIRTSLIALGVVNVHVDIQQRKIIVTHDPNSPHEKALGEALRTIKLTASIEKRTKLPP